MIPSLGAAAVERFCALASAWASLAGTLIWQSALVVGIFALAALGVKRASPGLRYWFWQVAAVKLLIMPLWGISIAVTALPRHDAGPDRDPRPVALAAGNRRWEPRDGARPEADDATPPQQEGHPLALPAVDGRAWLLLGWLFAVAGQVGLIAHQRVLLARRLRLAGAVDDETLVGLVAELAGRLRLKPPAVVVVDEGHSPFVCGLRRPTLVLPRDLAGTLGAGALRSVLLHELAHIQRRDLLWDWIPTITRVVYCGHPAAVYVVARSRLERELACDQAAMVLAGQGAGEYASTLVEVLGRSPASRSGARLTIERVASVPIHEE